MPYNNQMVSYGNHRDGRDGRGDRDGRDRDRHGRWRGRGRGWGWGGWRNDWSFFGLPYSYPVYAPQPLVYAAPPPPPVQVLAPQYAGPYAPYGNPYAPYGNPYAPYAGPQQTVLVGQDPLVGPDGIITPLGFKPRKIRKCKTRTVIARPQIPYQPSVLFIPRDVAKHFDICSIRVGQVLILGSRDPIPAEMYSANSGRGPAAIQLPPLLPGQHVYLTVRNHSSHDKTFRAGLNGLSF